MLMNVLLGGLFGGFSYIVRVFNPSMRLVKRYVCRVNVLHWPSSNLM
jgi:hypothetical protein